MKTESDPVCGTKIDKMSAQVQSTYGGRTYYFCSEKCKAKWDAHPERYANIPQSA